MFIVFILRYFAAIGAASACFVLLFISPVALWPAPLGIASGLVLLPMLLLVIAPVAALLALPWALGSELLAHHFGLSNYLFWIAAGGIAGGGCATFVAAVLHPYIPSDVVDEVTFGAVWLQIGPIGLVAGAFGGFMYRLTG